MKYISKNVLSKIERMKKKHLKKSMNDMKEIALRNSNNSDSGNNTRIQKSGMGKVSNSHSKKVGSILNSNAADKTIENMEKVMSGNKNNSVQKKIAKMKRDRDVIIKEEVAEFYVDGKELKVNYNSKEMSFSEFISKSKIDDGMSKILKSIMALKKKEGFDGSLTDFIRNNFGGKDSALDVVHRGEKVIFKKD